MFVIRWLHLSIYQNSKAYYVYDLPIADKDEGESYYIYIIPILQRYIKVK